MSSTHTVVDRIKNFIISSNLQPGDFLPPEPVLMENLQVSRSSIREAIKVLASLDIVKVQQGSGTQISNMSLSPFVNGLIFRSRVEGTSDFSTLKEVVSMRRLMDLAITDELIKTHRWVEHDYLETIVENMRHKAEAGQSFSDEDLAFHTELIRPLETTLLQQLVIAFWEVHTQTIPYLGIPEDRDIMHTVLAHKAILDAVINADATAYRQAVNDHYRPLERALDNKHY